MPTLGKRSRWLLLGALTIAVAALVVLVTIRGKQLGMVASAVLQAVSVALSIYGGVVFTREGNDQHVRAIARASARRVLVNYEALGRLSTAIYDLRITLRDYGKNAHNLLDDYLVDVALNGLQEQVLSQFVSADAAVQDWRDLAPAEVDNEVDRVKKSRSRDD